MQFNLATTVSFASMAVTLAGAAVAVRLARTPRGQHFYYATWVALSGALFCATNAVIAGGLGTELSVWSSRGNILAAVTHAVSWVAFLAAWDRRRLTRGERVVVVIGLLGAATALVPGGATTNSVTERTLGWWDVTYREADIGGLAIPILMLAYAAQVIAARAAFRMSRRVPGARSVMVTLSLLCAVGVLDLFTALRRTGLPYLADPAIALACLSIGAIVAADVAESAVKSADLERARATLVERENLAALGQLAAVVAHEVRNPVAIIFGALASLRRVERDERDTMLLGIVGDEAERLKQLIARLLDAVRPFELQYSRRRVAEVVRAGISRVAASADVDSREIELVEATTEEIDCDEVLLEQAISNIVRNALIADGRRAPVSVRAHVDASQPRTLRIDVVDDGKGVPVEAIPRLFTPFFTTRATGTGLGLALVKRIASAHGGSVEYESPSGGGARFTLRVPLRAHLR